MGVGFRRVEFSVQRGSMQGSYAVVCVSASLCVSPASVSDSCSFQSSLPVCCVDGGVVYRLPSQVAICQDAVIRNVIGRDELEKHLSLSYLHPGLSPAPPISLLSHLGVRHLRGSDITMVTTAMTKELLRVEGIHSGEPALYVSPSLVNAGGWSSASSPSTRLSVDAGLRQLAKLLVCNFRALEHGYGEEDSLLQTLRELPLIPLADGRVVSLSAEGVFFPMEETTTKKKKAQAHSGKSIPHLIAVTAEESGGSEGSEGLSKCPHDKNDGNTAEIRAVRERTGW